MRRGTNWAGVSIYWRAQYAILSTNTGFSSFDLAQVAPAYLSTCLNQGQGLLEILLLKRSVHNYHTVLKAIDEAEDEWAQHNIKKLIPTTGNLCQVIRTNFTYFHVKFGLDHRFVHVIDDEAKLQ